MQMLASTCVRQKSRVHMSRNALTHPRTHACVYAYTYVVEGEGLYTARTKVCAPQDSCAHKLVVHHGLCQRRRTYRHRDGVPCSKLNDGTPPLQLLGQRVVWTLTPNVKINNVHLRFIIIIASFGITGISITNTFTAASTIASSWNFVCRQVLFEVAAARCCSDGPVPQCVRAPTKGLVPVASRV